MLETQLLWTIPQRADLGIAIWLSSSAPRALKTRVHMDVCAKMLQEGEHCQPRKGETKQGSWLATKRNEMQPTLNLGGSWSRCVQSHPGSCAILCPLHPVTSKSAKTENRPVVAKGLGERWRDIINWIGRQLGDKELVGACVQLPGQTKEIPWVGDTAMHA